MSYQPARSVQLPDVVGIPTWLTTHQTLISFTPPLGNTQVKIASPGDALLVYSIAAPVVVYNLETGAGKEKIDNQLSVPVASVGVVEAAHPLEGMGSDECGRLD